MRRYHHVGIPAPAPREGSQYLPDYKVWAGGFRENPYGIEWMHYEPDCSLHELVKTQPHVAFEVDDLDRELEGKVVIIAPNSPSPGVRVAFIDQDGAPVEFLEFTDPDHPDRRG